MFREYNKLDPNVDLPGLAAATKNFSGAELEGLVRAAQSSAMNRLVKAGGKVVWGQFYIIHKFRFKLTQTL